MVDLIRNSSAVTLASEDGTCSLSSTPMNGFYSYDEVKSSRPQTALESRPRRHSNLHCHSHLLPSIISTILNTLKQDRNILQSTTTPFYALELPPISIQNYATRLVRFSHCPPGGVLIALHYIHKLTRQGLLQVTDETVHRVLLTAIVLAAKFSTDFYMSNTYYARVGGIHVQELNVLEMEMLKLLKWDLFVGEESYQDQVENWVIHMVMKNGKDNLREFMTIAGFCEGNVGNEWSRDAFEFASSPCSSARCSPCVSPARA